LSAAPRETWLPMLAGMVQDRLGLHFPPERWPDLVRGVRSAARETGTEDTDGFARGLLRTRQGGTHFETLANALTIGETYFFRERRAFEVLEQTILPALIRERRGGLRRLRLWSAGCCTGEEAYTLAILLDRLLPERSDWQITILATDLNPRFLRVAARGEYGEWSFREAPAGLKERCFTPSAHGRLAIAARIRRMVKFAQLNLADLAYPRCDNDTHSMDVILCRNVLMYFSPESAQRVVQQFRHSLVDGGWFSVSATESPVRPLEGLCAQRFDGVVFHRKGVAAPRSADIAAGPAAVAVRAAEPVPLEAAPAAAGTAPAEPPAADSDPLAMAHEHANAGRLDLALAAVEGALAAAKMDAGAHQLHAAILDELGRVGDAQAALKRALYLEPGFVLAHHALGQLALRAGRPLEAQRHFANALSLLARHGADDVLPRSDGLAAGQLKALIDATLAKAKP
jgi:chemotaxis protein methyltransferase CheR